MCQVLRNKKSTNIKETVYVETPRFDSPLEQSYRVHAELLQRLQMDQGLLRYATMSLWICLNLISKNEDDSVIARWEVPHVLAEGSSVQNKVSLTYKELATGREASIVSVPVAHTKWTISNLGEIAWDADVCLVVVLVLLVEYNIIVVCNLYSCRSAL